MNWEKLDKLSAYQLVKQEKQPLFNRALISLAKHHYQQCQSYRLIVDSMYPDFKQVLDGFELNSAEFRSQINLDTFEVPTLSVSLFKHHLLQSICDDQIFKITTSSGTTSAQVSKIVLDKENIKRQQKVLSSIVKEWLGPKRLPMLIIDHANVIKDKYSYSARGVGIQGLSIFGHHHVYALDDNMELDLDTIDTFFKSYKNEPIFIFGFTYMVWQYFICALEKLGKRYDLSNVIVFHSGGWKKLQNIAVSNQEFNDHLRKVLTSSHHNIIKIHNFYGMVEQTGTIYVECEQGFFHCPVYSDVIIRDKQDFSIVGMGIEGIIQVSSLLPTSYPGHALLTEDIGVMIGEDNCFCGRHGKYFKVSGRIEKAQMRGCSDSQP